MNKSYRTKSFKERYDLYLTLRNQYPDCIPIIVQKDPRETFLNNLDKKNFLIPNSCSFSMLKMIILNRLQIRSSISIWFRTDKSLIYNPEQKIIEIYNEDRNSDGFLYIYYKSEDSYG